MVRFRENFRMKQDLRLGVDVSMRWVGLTGGIGTGKSSVAEIFRQHGIPVVDADDVARIVVAQGTRGLNQVAMEFGEGILAEDGTLDRKKLGQIVFADPKKLAALEGILHPLIREHVDLERRDLEMRGHDVAIYDVPLLFEKRMEPMFESIIVVHCKPEQQIERLKKRNGMSEEEAKNRIAQQLNLEDKIKKAKYVIDNSGPVEALGRQVTAIIAKLGSQKR